MATDFSKPIVTDAYATLLPGVVAAHLDLARQLEPTLTGTSTNVPTGAVRWNASTIRWERYNGASWVTLPSAGDNVYAISISGNAATAAACSGNAASATKLATARTIGGVAFDGTANINLPGVNAAGTQNTSGTAATATIAYNALGVFQYFSNNLAVRALATTYTSPATRTISVMVTVQGGGSDQRFYLNIGGSGADFHTVPAGKYANIEFIVPPNTSYRVECPGATLANWFEVI